MAISKQLQAFTAISWNFQSFLTHSVTFRKYMNSHYFILQRVPSWDSVPILLCSEMQAPHWSQSLLLDSQWWFSNTSTWFLKGPVWIGWHNRKENPYWKSIILVQNCKTTWIENLTKQLWQWNAGLWKQHMCQFLQDGNLPWLTDPV